LTASAEHDPAVRAPFDDGAPDVEADRRVIDRCFAVRAEIVDGVAQPLQRRFEVLFQEKAGVIGADSNAHGLRLYYGA